MGRAELKARFSSGGQIGIGYMCLMLFNQHEALSTNSSQNSLVLRATNSNRVCKRSCVKKNVLTVSAEEYCSATCLK